MSLCPAMLSTSMALTAKYKLVLALHMEGFQLHVPTQCSEMIEDANVLSHFMQDVQQDSS